MKKAITILLALLMVLSLAACGDDNSTTNTPAATETPATPKEDFFGEWENYETGDTITIDSEDIIFESKDGGSYQSGWEFAEITGDTLKDNEPIGELRLTTVNGFKQLVGSSGVFITLEEANQRRNSESKALGEKYEGENFEITIKNVSFDNVLNKNNTTRVFERDVGQDKPGDGKIYMIINFDYTNLAKTAVDMVRDVKFTVIYKDSYEFVSFEEDKAYIFEDDINGVFRSCRLDTGGYLMELSPLTSDSFVIAIPVAEIVNTDTNSSLEIKVDYGKNIKGGASIVETAYFNVDGENVKRYTEDAPSVTSITSEEISSILISHQWERVIDENSSAVMEFSDDEMGKLDFTDGTHYDLKWKANSDETVSVTLIVDGRDAPGKYNFIEKTGEYQLVNEDNSTFTYIAQ